MGRQAVFWVLSTWFHDSMRRVAESHKQRTGRRPQPARRANPAHATQARPHYRLRAKHTLRELEFKQRRRIPDKFRLRRQPARDDHLQLKPGPVDIDALFV